MQTSGGERGVEFNENRLPVRFTSQEQRAGLSGKEGRGFLKKAGAEPKQGGWFKEQDTGVQDQLWESDTLTLSLESWLHDFPVVGPGASHCAAPHLCAWAHLSMEETTPALHPPYECDGRLDHFGGSCQPQVS